jgi:hypothetical protein
MDVSCELNGYFLRIKWGFLANYMEEMGAVVSEFVAAHYIEGSKRLRDYVNICCCELNRGFDVITTIS